MPSKKDVEKRRVAAQQAAEAQERADRARTRKKRRTTGLIGGFLVVALVLPLIGIIAVWLGDGGDDDVIDADEVLEAQPADLRPVPQGAALTGPTPCPATDGTQERTTSFEEAPSTCIDPDAGYSVELLTDLGPVVVDVDPSLSPEAANLFVTNARYGVYDDVPFHIVFPEGYAVTGDPGPGDAGFRIPADAGDATYEVGSVVMYADTEGTIGTQFALVSTPLIAGLFAEEQAHAPVGTVREGQEVLDVVIALAGDEAVRPLPVADVRIQSATVTETGAPESG